MLEALEIGDIPAAKARVVEKAMTAQPLSPHGTNQHGKEDFTQVKSLGGESVRLPHSPHRAGPPGHMGAYEARRV